jgi:uncharacterized membrane protein
MPRPATRSDRPLARESLGAIVLVLFSLPAALFGIFLTALKLRTEHRCDGFLQNACSSGCSTALGDAWAVVLGLPLSIYASAFYAVVLLNAFFVGLWPATFAAPARFHLLVLGLGGVGVSLALGVYLSLGLGTWCEFCTLLYLANLGIFLAAWLHNPEGVLRGLWRGVRRVELVGLTMIVVSLTAFLALVLVQRRVYLEAVAAAAVDRAQFSGLTCSEEQIRALPPTRLKLASEGPPEVLVAVFVDFACGHCRNESSFWRDYQAEHGDFLQVEFFHFSADSACGPLDSAPLQRNQSCNAALALECMTELAPGDEFRQMDRLFALQDGPEPYFALEHVAALEQELGVPGLVACMEGPEPLARVRRHITFGVQSKLTAPPSTLLIPLHAGEPHGQALAFRGGGKSRAFVDQAIAEARARSQSDE